MSIKLLVVLSLLLPEVFLAGVPDHFVRDERPFRADAIVVLLGSHRAERTDRAVQLYRAGYAPGIVFGGGYFRRQVMDGGRIAESFYPAGQRYRSQVLARGVPEKAVEIIPFQDTNDTVSELVEILSFAHHKGWHRLIVVSSATHTARIRSIVDRLGTDLEVRVVATSDEELRHWWTCPRCIRELVHECGGWIKEMLRRGARQR